MEMEVIIVGGYGRVFISVLYGYEVVEVASLGFFILIFLLGIVVVEMEVVIFVVILWWFWRWVHGGF